MLRALDSVTDPEPQGGQSRRHNDGWLPLPNDAARDKRLIAADLVLLAYRGTFGDDRAPYALNVTALLTKPIVRGSGFGRNVIQRALRKLREAGYLKR